MDAVRCFVGKDNKSWDTFVPQIVGAMRASINRSTGLTPNKMMLGREVVAPAELVFPLGECVNLQPDPVDPETYVDALERNLQQAFLTAREKLKTTQKIMKRDYDVKIRRREYSEGDMVYVLNNSVKKGRSRKLAPKWKGPGLVIEKITPYLYRVKQRKTIDTVNHDRMKSVTLGIVPAWLEQARKELSENSNGKESEMGSQSKEVFCLCGKPDDGKLMIQCDQCSDWFHGKCVSIDHQEAQRMRVYFCPLCETERTLDERVPV